MQVDISKFLRSPASFLMEANLDKAHIRLTRHGRMTHVVLPLEGMDPGDTVRFYWKYDGDALRNQRTFVFDPEEGGSDWTSSTKRLPGDDCGASPSTYKLYVGREASGSGESFRLREAKMQVGASGENGRNCGCNFSVIEQEHMEYPENGAPFVSRTWFCTLCHRRYTDSEWQTQLALQNERIQAGYDAQERVKATQKKTTTKRNA
jgi:hypothetical protein